MLLQDHDQHPQDKLDPALRCGSGPVARYRYLLRELLTGTRRVRR